jgi:hypothetical protein
VRTRRCASDQLVAAPAPLGGEVAQLQASSACDGVRAARSRAGRPPARRRSDGPALAFQRQRAAQGSGASAVCSCAGSTAAIRPSKASPGRASGRCLRAAAGRLRRQRLQQRHAVAPFGRPRSAGPAALAVPGPARQLRRSTSSWKPWPRAAAPAAARSVRARRRRPEQREVQAGGSRRPPGAPASSRTGTRARDAGRGAVASARVRRPSVRAFTRSRRPALGRRLQVQRHGAAAAAPAA